MGVVIRVFTILAAAAITAAVAGFFTANPGAPINGWHILAVLLAAAAAVVAALTERNTP